MAKLGLQVETFVDFNFAKLKKDVKDIIKDAIDDSKDDVVKTFKSNIENATHFKSNNYISPMTKSVRLIRGRTGTKPLIDTGKLINSIKKTKGGISMMAYGWRQHDGFTLKSNRKDGGRGFYAPNKRAKAKVVKIVPRASLKIPARPWIIWTPDKEVYDKIYSKFMKGLSLTRAVRINKIKIF